MHVLDCVQMSTAEIQTEVLLCIGGQRQNGITSTGEVYDPASDSWHSVAPMSTERRQAEAATWNGKVVVAGGYDSQRVTLKSTEQYDAETNQWTAFRSLLTARAGHALVNADNTLFAIGGWDYRGNSNSVERYNTKSGVWQEAPPLQIPRSDFASATLRVCYSARFILFLT